MRIRIPAVALLTLLLSSLSFAQENKLVQFHMAIVKKGPNWTDAKTAEAQKVREEHLSYVMSLLGSGKAVVAGPFGNDDEIQGIFIFRAASADEAKSWADADPAAKAGHHLNEMHQWWSEDIFGKAATPMKLETVYFGFLKRGPNRKEGDGQTPEVQELQKAHIANINRLAEAKKLVMAGPFGGNGDLRGIFVFRVGSLKEAQDLAATDPMIKIDRLRLELHEWTVPAGVIP
ncbi:MAG TPA: YciI family protein [Pyrinomonadaceae bacterium]